MLDERLDVQVEGVAGDGVGALGGQLTLLEQQRQQGEQRVPEGEGEGVLV